MANISPGRPEPLPLPQAIFFDWDGTLVDSLAFLTGAHNHVKSRLGLPAITEEDFLQYFGMPRDYLYAEMYGNMATEAKTLFEAYYISNHLAEICLAEGVVDLLEYVYSRGVIMGIVSNKKGDFLRTEVLHLGWDRYFGDRVIGSTDAPRDKPFADPLIMAVNKSSQAIDLKKLWYVGDTETDLACAQNTGCISVVIKDLRKMNNFQIQALDHAIKFHNPALVVKNCAEIHHFLLQSL
jgi:phosphoglycolate phosphatase